MPGRRLPTRARRPRIRLAVLPAPQPTSHFWSGLAGSRLRLACAHGNGRKQFRALSAEQGDFAVGWRAGTGEFRVGLLACRGGGRSKISNVTASLAQEFRTRTTRVRRSFASSACPAVTGSGGLTRIPPVTCVPLPWGTRAVTERVFPFLGRRIVRFEQGRAGRDVSAT